MAAYDDSLGRESKPAIGSDFSAFNPAPKPCSKKASLEMVKAG